MHTRPPSTLTTHPMAYVKNEGAVESIRPSLALLEAGQQCTWENPPEGTANFAYKVRQALAYAAAHAALYPALAEAYARFEIRDRGTRVEAKFRVRPATVTPAPTSGPQYRETSSLHSIHTLSLESVPVPLSMPLTVTGPQSHFTIIETCTRTPGSVMNFPDATLDSEALTKLYRWAKLQQPELMLMAEPSIMGLTVSPIDPEVEEFQWRPEGE
jgi:hypothetical protein